MKIICLFVPCLSGWFPGVCLLVRFIYDLFDSDLPRAVDDICDFSQNNVQLPKHQSACCMQDCIAAIASVHRKDRPREKKQISRFIHMFTYVRQIPPERQFLCPTPQVHCLDTTEENGWVTKPCLCVCVCVPVRTSFI